MNTLFLTLLLAAQVFAIPQLINYQGQLTSPTGTPLDTTVAMTFALYPTASGSAADWTETHAAVTVIDGLFNVSLGSVNLLGDWFGTPHWLGIAVGNNTEMTPRQEVTSVAHAFRTGSVDGANGGMISGAVSVGEASNLLLDEFTFAAGSSHTVSGGAASVTGGYINTASGLASHVGGGGWNKARGNFSVISGGGSLVEADSNSAQGEASVIGGGVGNTTTGDSSVIGGGTWNTAGGETSTVGGGHHNTASGWRATVVGGSWNTASNINSYIGCGAINTASGISSAVCGGQYNSARGFDSFVGGGFGNVAGGTESFVGGGRLCYARGWCSVVAGGGGDNPPDSNSASGDFSAIGGGQRNSANAYGSVVSGGSTNTASGFFSVVPGGKDNSATGDYSCALGRNAQALHRGAFVFCDSRDSSLTSTADDQFSVRATGGYRLFSNWLHTSGVTLAASGSSWVSVSDSTKKRDIHLTDTKAVLDKVASLPIKNWEYQSEAEGTEHIGPMAQDFWSKFQLGNDSLGIATIDADGVLFAAVQELAKQNERQAREITELKQLVSQLVAIGKK